MIRKLVLVLLVLITLAGMITFVLPVSATVINAFYTTPSDGFLVLFDGVWNTVRTASSTGGVYSATSQAYVRVTGSYQIERTVLYFDTFNLPDTANITDAKLYVYIFDKDDDYNAKVYIVQGMPDYPNDPLIGSDYNYANYGSFATNYGYCDVGSNITINQYNQINVENSTVLKGIVNKTGYTKIMLVEGHDYNNSAPGGLGTDGIALYTNEQGAGFIPYLEITWATEIPSIQADNASVIARHSARLNASVIFDGYESSQVRFGYGNTTQTAANFSLYQVTTNWSDAEWDIGEHPYYDASSLNGSTTYYYRAQIKNSAGNMTSASEANFATVASVLNPTNLRGYPTQTSVSLSWGNGSGSGQTQVVYSPSGFPTSNTTGTVIYEGVVSQTTHNNLAAGHTYYYSAWGESGGEYSANYTTLAVTTQAFQVTTNATLETPTSFAEWFQEPDYTNLSNLEPVYSAVNEVADSFGTPRNTAWMGLIVTLIAISSTMVMIKSTWIAGVVVASMEMLGGVAIHILPAWMIFVVVLFGVAWWAMNSREQGTE